MLLIDIENKVKDNHVTHVLNSNKFWNTLLLKFQLKFSYNRLLTLTNFFYFNFDLIKIQNVINIYSLLYYFDLIMAYIDHLITYYKIISLPFEIYIVTFNYVENI